MENPDKKTETMWHNYPDVFWYCYTQSNAYMNTEYDSSCEDLYYIIIVSTNRDIPPTCVTLSAPVIPWSAKLGNPEPSVWIWWPDADKSIIVRAGGQAQPEEQRADENTLVT